VVREMAFICRGISHDRNYYCVGVQAVRLIDAERRHWDLSHDRCPVASIPYFTYKLTFFLLRTLKLFKITKTMYVKTINTLDCDQSNFFSHIFSPI